MGRFCYRLQWRRQYALGGLGDGTTLNRSSPVPVVESIDNPIDDVIKISAGTYHSLFLKSDGTLWRTGYNGYGELGYPGGLGSNSKTAEGSLGIWKQVK